MSENWLENISFHHLPKLWNYYLFAKNPPVETMLWKRIQGMMNDPTYYPKPPPSTSAYPLPKIEQVPRTLVMWMAEGYNVWASDYLDLYWTWMEPSIRATREVVRTAAELHSMLLLWNLLAAKLNQPWLAQADLYELDYTRATMVDVRELWLQVKVHLKRLYHNFAVDRYARFWFQQTGCHLPALVQSVIDQQMTFLAIRWLSATDIFVPLMQPWPLTLEPIALETRPEALRYVQFLLRAPKKTLAKKTSSHDGSRDTDVEDWTMPKGDASIQNTPTSSPKARKNREDNLLKRGYFGGAGKDVKMDVEEAKPAAGTADGTSAETAITADTAATTTVPDHAMLKAFYKRAPKPADDDRVTLALLGQITAELNTYLDLEKDRSVRYAALDVAYKKIRTLRKMSFLSDIELLLGLMTSLESAVKVLNSDPLTAAEKGEYEIVLTETIRELLAKCDLIPHTWLTNFDSTKLFTNLYERIIGIKGVFTMLASFFGLGGVASATSEVLSTNWMYIINTVFTEDVMKFVSGIIGSRIEIFLIDMAFLVMVKSGLGAYLIGSMSPLSLFPSSFNFDALQPNESIGMYCLKMLLSTMSNGSNLIKATPGGTVLRDLMDMITNGTSVHGTGMPDGMEFIVVAIRTFLSFSSTNGSRACAFLLNNTTFGVANTIIIALLSWYQFSSLQIPSAGYGAYMTKLVQVLVHSSATSLILTLSTRALTANTLTAQLTTMARLLSSFKTTIKSTSMLAPVDGDMHRMRLWFANLDQLSVQNMFLHSLFAYSPSAQIAFHSCQYLFNIMYDIVQCMKNPKELWSTIQSYVMTFVYRYLNPMQYIRTGPTYNTMDSLIQGATNILGVGLSMEQVFLPDCNLLQSLETHIHQNPTTTTTGWSVRNTLSEYNIKSSDDAIKQVDSCIADGEVVAKIPDRASRVLMCTSHDIKEVIDLADQWNAKYPNQEIIPTLTADAKKYFTNDLKITNEEQNPLYMDLVKEMVKFRIDTLENYLKESIPNSYEDFLKSLSAFASNDLVTSVQGGFGDKVRVYLHPPNTTGEYFAKFFPSQKFVEYINHAKETYMFAMAIITMDRLQWVHKIQLLSMLMHSDDHQSKNPFAPEIEDLNDSDYVTTGGKLTSESQTVQLSDRFKERLLWVTMLAKAENLQMLEFLDFRTYVFEFWEKHDSKFFNEVINKQSNFPNLFANVCKKLNGDIAAPSKEIPGKLNGLVNQMRNLKILKEADNRQFQQLKDEIGYTDLGHNTHVGLFTATYVELYRKIRVGKFSVTHAMCDIISQPFASLNSIVSIHDYYTPLVQIWNTVQAWLEKQFPKRNKRKFESPAADDDLEANNNQPDDDDADDEASNDNSRITQPDDESNSRITQPDDESNSRITQPGTPEPIRVVLVVIPAEALHDKRYVQYPYRHYHTDSSVAAIVDTFQV